MTLATRTAQAIAGHLRRQIDEIAREPALRWYGFSLACVHFVSFTYMAPSTRFFLAEGGWPICWPMFEGCAALRSLPDWIWQAAFGGYLAAATAAAALFLDGRRLRGAYWTLALATAVKFAIFAQDYRFMGNYHYMPFLATLAFLLAPDKARSIPLLICLFYVSAGGIKITREWLSGATLGGPLSRMPPPLRSLSLVYVVYLELIFVWGVFAKRAWLRWLTFAQLATFHAASYFWVGYFYPSVMALLLTIFPLLWTLARGRFPTGVAEAWPRPALSRAAIALFALAQLVPRAMEGDPAVTGRGRMFSLNMFDARTECFDSTWLRYRGRTIEASREIEDDYKVRVHCDPAVFLQYARQACEREKASPDFIDLDLAVYSKRSTDQAFRRIVDVRNACAKRPTYSALRATDWIDP